MKNFLVGFTMGFVITYFSTVLGFCITYDNKLKSVGIERIVSCEINTPNCHSNWNEIVWLDK